jgi:hypothetical protein
MARFGGGGLKDACFGAGMALVFEGDVEEWEGEDGVVGGIEF